MRSKAMTSPSGTSARASSHPTCPFFPVSRIFTETLRHRAAASLRRLWPIVLDETSTDSSALELPFVPALEEEAARIAEYAGLEEQHFRESGRRDLHLSRWPSRSSDSR